MPLHHGRCLTAIVALAVAAGASVANGQVMVPGGGPRKTDCIAQLAAGGVPFPAGSSRPHGLTCYDGDDCDGDAARNGVCAFSVSLCLNLPHPALLSCVPSDVANVTLKLKGEGADALRAAVSALELPSAAPQCSAPAAVNVAVGGPNEQGEYVSGKLGIKSKARPSQGKVDKDDFRLVCLPAPLVPTSTTLPVVTSTTTTTSTSTTMPSSSTTTTTTGGGTTTTTTLPPPGPPGAGLQAEILSATVAGDGTVTATFTLTDDEGIPVTPSGPSTTDPRKARVRMIIDRLEENVIASASGPLTYTDYMSYIVNSSGNPAFDSGGTFATIDPQGGVYTYTFKTKLPAGFPASLTHTIGAQIDRTNPETGGSTLRANPILDFVPAGGDVVTVREPVTTAECNQCHNPLAIHGGGRREIDLCQLCHTQQLSGGDGEFRVMVHRIHRGKNLPSIVEGDIGDEYEFGGHVYGKKVKACVGGALAGLPCEEDGDCPSGTCTGATTEGVAFPKDLRRCDTCHQEGPTATHYKTHPGPRPCTACHDTVNPSLNDTDAGPPGWNHISPGDAGFAFPDSACVSCHTPDDGELEVSVPSITGVHTVPERSEQLGGLAAEILEASGTPGNPVVIRFSVKDKAGTPINVKTRKTCSAAASNKGAACTVNADCTGGTCGFEFTTRFVISGPQTDFGGAANPDPGLPPPPYFQPSAVGTTVNGVLSDLAGDGTFTFMTDANNSLPATAAGTWRVGLEVRHTVYIDLPYEQTDVSVTEAAENRVRDFSVDGSAVTPRRMPVETAACEGCHSEFSFGFSLHGNLRNQVEYCVLCHNPNKTDFDRAKNAIALGGGTMNETINFKHLIHKLHRGEAMAAGSYVIYGFGSAPLNFTPHDFKEIRFPGNLADCGKCHTGDSYTLPLAEGAPVLPTRLTEISGATPGTAVEVATGQIAPITDACTSCHDSDAAFAHAETNTTSSGQEACEVCHGESSIAPVSGVHAAHVE